MSHWMKLRSWLRGPVNPARACRTVRARLTIELLEDRIVPTGALPAIPAGLGASSDFRGIIGLDAAQASYPYRGDGYSVAVIDTGINYNDPNLGGGWGKRVIDGYNFVNNTTNPMDDNGHGTFVAGEIASSSALYPGVAPAANLIALKALDENDTGSWTNIDAALKWVISHQAQDHIVAINLSLGSGNYTTDGFNLLETDLAALKSAGVLVAVASGNNFANVGSVPGLAYPAVDPDVVSVGATWAGSYGSVTFYGATDNATAVNQIAGFTQRDSALSLLAPGAWINGEALNGGYTQFGGTSMSAAVVTGAAVVLHQALDATGQSASATPANILHLMQSTGLAIQDNNTSSNVTPTGLTFRQLNLKAALDAVVPRSALAIAAVPTQALAPGKAVIVPLSATDNAGATVTFAAQAGSVAGLAYQLNQQLGLSTTGSYYQNRDGANEKWLIGKNLQWYWLLPDGTFRRFAGSAAATLQPANLVATLDPTYYADPRTLWYAPYVAPAPVSVAINGNQLTVQSTSPTWTGSVVVTVTASDGRASVQTAFTVNVAFPSGATVVPPTTALSVAPIAAQTMAPGRAVVVPLSATDTAGATVTFAAQAYSPAALAYQLNHQLGLSTTGSYYLNRDGANEKWLIDKNLQWYWLLPDGTFRRFAGSAAATMQPANLVATFDPTYYADPRNLWYAAYVAPAPVTASINGSQLTVQSTSPTWTGSVIVAVTASDGTASATTSFTLTVKT